MELKEAQNKLQAILFASGEAVQGARLAIILGIDEKMVYNIVQSVNDMLEEITPLHILKLQDSYQLVTKPEFAEVIKGALESKRNTPLSSAALEVLAIIAYNQPVTKAFIEQVRGVDSSSVVNSLVEKGLIEERGRLEIPGKPLCYGTAVGFLRCFGLSGIEQLPPIPMEQVTEQIPDK
ncbi:MAG: SMC-Scp complex subunit ScpB [Oscillospiraceae bacterium]